MSKDLTEMFARLEVEIGAIDERQRGQAELQGTRNYAREALS